MDTLCSVETTDECNVARDERQSLIEFISKVRHIDNIEELSIEELREITLGLIRD